MGKHTPWPWAVGQIKAKKQCVYIDAPHGDSRTGMVSWTGMAKCYGCVDDHERGTEAMLANAYLMAAAPELLEALEELMVAVEKATNAKTAGEEQVALVELFAPARKARAAIAKAKGEA